MMPSSNPFDPDKQRDPIPNPEGSEPGQADDSSNLRDFVTTDPSVKAWQCYYCGATAQKTCTDCGRFVCSNHTKSVYKISPVVCPECTRRYRTEYLRGVLIGVLLILLALVLLLCLQD